MNTYFTRLIDYHNQLSGSAEEISEDSFVTHLFTHIPKEFATTINIFERQAPPPTSQHIMDAIRLDEEKAALVTEIADASTGAALYSQREAYRGRGRGGSGRFGRQKTHRCTYCKMDNHTTEACGKRKRAHSGNGNPGGNDSSGGDNAGRNDQKACYHCPIFTTNERRKHETEFAKAQLQSPPLEIEISSDYPAMLSPPPPPNRVGSSIPGPLTICATIAACSSHSRNYADQCSLNLAMIAR